VAIIAVTEDAPKLPVVSAGTLRDPCSQILFAPELQHEQRPRPRPRSLARQKAVPDLVHGTGVEQGFIRAVAEKCTLDDGPHFTEQPSLEWKRESEERENGVENNDADDGKNFERPPVHKLAQPAMQPPDQQVQTDHRGKQADGEPLFHWLKRIA
jgi:hypothetical protein